ncbi:MAG: isoprenylcysteine carboxylmethyltransferase family protein [Deltaproteobacteria bacterium]|nr:isoprenylcysteine carboxylmethyltransferase family protein [Deltaproteobacteria bacterium]
MPLLAGLDVGWLHLAPVGGAVSALGFAGLVASMALNDWTMATNPFLSTVVRVQTERGHRVVDTGPYALVRHPMYLAGLVGTLALPPALGTLLPLPASLALAAVLVLRTAHEDEHLCEELAGYPAYAGRVKRRLLPGLW